MKKFLLTLAAVMAATCSIEAASGQERSAASPFATRRAAQPGRISRANVPARTAQMGVTAPSAVAPAVSAPAITPSSSVFEQAGGRVIESAPVNLTQEVPTPSANLASGLGRTISNAGLVTTSALPDLGDTEYLRSAQYEFIPTAPVAPAAPATEPWFWQKWFGGTETAAPTETATEGGLSKYLPTRESLSKYVPTRESLTERWKNVKSGVSREALQQRWEDLKTKTSSGYEGLKTGVSGSFAGLQSTAAEAAKPITEAYEAEGFAAACKAAGGEFKGSVEYRPKTYAAVGIGLTTALAGYVWYRWYNQQEKQILRAATGGNIEQTGKLLNQLVANVNAAAGTPDFAKKQIAALNIFRDIFTQVEQERPARTLIINWDGLYAKVNEIGGPHYVAWTLAELKPVYTKLFKHSVEADADFKNFIQEAALTSGNNPDEIRDIVLAGIVNAASKDNDRIREQHATNITRANALINTKFSQARQAALERNAIINPITKQKALNVINELHGTQAIVPGKE